MIDPALEAQYNVRAAIPDHADYFDAWGRAGVATMLNHQCLVDVPYGPTPSETMDVFSVDGPGAPFHLFIHGGYWQGRDKGEFRFVADPFLERGIGVALMNYALCPAVDLDAIVDQTRRAFAWLWANVARFGGDPARIRVSGHSAGGHLVAMLMATDWPSVDPKMPVDPIERAVAISGLFDLDPLRSTSINEAVGMDAETAARNSPVLLEPRAKPPLTLVVGGGESPAFHEQADRLAGEWSAKGVRIDRIAVPECHHLSIVQQLAFADSPVFTSLSEG